MACSLSHQIPPHLLLNSSPLLEPSTTSVLITLPHRPPLNFGFSIITTGSNLHSRSDLFRLCRTRRRSVSASSRCGEQFEYGSSSNGSGGGSCLNSPLEPKTPVGRSLCRVLLDEPRSFHRAAYDALNRLSEDRDAAIARMTLCLGSDEASLHRRIAQLKEHECQMGVEDVMCMVIYYKFSEIKVPLIPRFHECVYNGRLEILPSKDWQLESIHSMEVLEMIREYLTIVLGWKSGSGVVADWSTTQVHRGHLSRVYAGSILFGYFLKSASWRHHLERSLPPHDDPLGNWTCAPEPSTCFLRILFFDQCFWAPTSTTTSQVSSTLSGDQNEDFRCYLLRFGTETLQACAKPTSQQAMNLIENHCSALFWGNAGSLETNELILTSFSSLKRLVLEAIAFGSFLWDAERLVEKVYDFQS
ncbi:hypothetical protein Dimus_016982 [Dionaea muscipula]